MPSDQLSDDLTILDFALDAPLETALAQELLARILYLDPQIEASEPLSDGDYLIGVRLSCRRGVDRQGIARKLAVLVEGSIRPQLAMPYRRVWRSPNEIAPGSGEVFDELVCRELVIQVGAGQVALGGYLTRLLDHLDHTLTEILRRNFDVTEYVYPTLIRTEALRKAGYFDSFPHHMMFATRLHNDLDTYRAAADRFSERTLDASVLDFCRDVDHSLPPTLCYHSFDHLEGRRLRSETLVITTRGKAFRYEAGYATTMARLWDFTIREMVFVGAAPWVVSSRETLMSEVFDWFSALGLAGECVVANDPFFGGEAVAGKVTTQRMLELKYELRASLGAEGDVAVASFNLHNDLFTDRFAIEGQTGGAVASGCIGFGLERLLYAFLCQHGVEPAGWPPSVRTALSL